MERGIILNLEKHQHHHKISYNNSFYNCKTYVQPPRRTQQRLIPLTSSILKVMTDFNASSSSTSISEELFYITIPITSLVRGEVQNILQDLSNTNQFISKEEIDDLIVKCLRENVTIIQESDTILNISEQCDFKQLQEVDITADKNKNKVFENFHLLEHRITDLEERFNTIIAKLRYTKADQFQINTSVIKEEIPSMMEIMDAEINNGKQRTQLEKYKGSTKEKPFNIYDDMYYRRREYFINLLNYKKSLETIKLNEKSVLNPYVKPYRDVLPKFRKKLKQGPMFLTTNEI